MKRNTFITLVLLALPAIAAAQSYNYDEAGRLVRAAYAQGGGGAYAYDAQDNLTAVSPLAVLSAPLDVEVSRLSGTSARISWGADASATGYVQRRQHNNLSPSPALFLPGRNLLDFLPQQGRQTRFSGGGSGKRPDLGEPRAEELVGARACGRC